MSQMQVFRIHRFGGPETLLHETASVPDPGPDDVLVKVAAAGLNPVDHKTRAGKYPLVRLDQLPYTLGRDCAGTVQEVVGPQDTVKAGQPVYAFVGQGQGTYAEYARVPREAVAPKPESLDLTTAAAVPLAALTAWQGLFDHGGLEAGQTVLIHAASGGVGHFAVQFAKARGAQVIATASGDAMGFVRELGADTVIDYRKQRFEREAPPVDMVFDLVGGETQARSWPLVREGGAFVSTLAEPSAREAEARGVRASRYTAQPDGAQLALIGRLIDAGKVRVHVSRVFDLAEMEAAQRALEAGHIRGKLVARW